MDIKKSASFLKRKIDSFSCNLIIHGEEIIGLEALRYWLKNNYRTSPIKSEIYVSRALTKLYKILEQNEAGFIQNSDHFTFMKDVDIFYTILKGLGITFEELMEPGKHKFKSETEYDKLHNDNQEIKSLLHELTNVCSLGFTKTDRSSFEEKQKEFQSFFTFHSVCKGGGIGCDLCVFHVGINCVVFCIFKNPVTDGSGSFFCKSPPPVFF